MLQGLSATSETRQNKTMMLVTGFVFSVNTYNNHVREIIGHVLLSDLIWNVCVGLVLVWFSRAFLLDQFTEPRYVSLSSFVLVFDVWRLNRATSSKRHTSVKVRLENHRRPSDTHFYFNTVVNITRHADLLTLAHTSVLNETSPRASANFTNRC